MDVGREWLAGLTPARPCTVEDSVCSPALLADAVAELGPGPVCWAIVQAAVAVEHVAAELPGNAAGRASIELLRHRSEATTLHLLLRLARPSVSHRAISDESLVGIADVVRRAVPLDQELRAIRFAHADLARALLQACERLVPAQRLGPEMAAISAELFGYVDTYTDELTRSYLAEHDRWVTSVAAARLATVQALLGDRPADPATASRRLGYPLDRTHRCVIAWSDDPADEGLLQPAATDLLQAWGATATLVVPVGSGRIWAWGAVPGGPDAHRVMVDGSVHVAVGSAAPAIDGFRRSHTEATRVQRLRALAGPTPPRTTCYDDVVLPALLAADLDAAGEFVRRELGELAGPGETAAALRSTVLHYLDAERSLVRVAEQLHIARGTVAYRVKRAQQILGRDLGDRRLPLHAALLLAHELGDVVLVSPARTV